MPSWKVAQHASVLCVVFYPELNPRYREGAGIYGEALTESGRGTFEVRTLEEVVGSFGAAVGEPWESEFRVRYLGQDGAGVAQRRLGRGRPFAG